MKIMKRLIPVAIALPCLIVISVSCSKDESLDNANNDFVPIELTHMTRSFVKKGNDFGFRLLEQVADQEEGDVMISPLGINLIFGIILEGATEGEAMEEVCNVLGFEGGSREDVRDYCKTMLDRLPEMDKQTKVNIANMVLTNNGFGKSNKTFEDNLYKHYGTKVMNRSFYPEETLVKEINSWAEKQTEGMLKDVLQKGDVNSKSTISILLNSLYFKGKWAEEVKFDKSMTAEEDFTTDSGKTAKVDMMKKKVRRIGYSQSSVGGFLSIPYGNGAFAMTLYLPDKGVGIKDFLSHLAKGDLRLESGFVEADLWLPRFTCENKRIDLVESIQKVGIKKAFEDPWLRLFDSDNGNSGIDTFFQSTKIAVDEDGTEAAAVTVVTQDVAAPPTALPPQITFHCDHPFLYTITETSTGAILFAGIFRGE